MLIPSVQFNGPQKASLTSGVLAVLSQGAAAAGVLPAADFVFLLGLIQQLAVGLYAFPQLVTAAPAPVARKAASKSVSTAPSAGSGGGGRPGGAKATPAARTEGR